VSGTGSGPAAMGWRRHRNRCSRWFHQAGNASEPFPGVMPDSGPCPGNVSGERAGSWRRPRKRCRGRGQVVEEGLETFRRSCPTKGHEAGAVSGGVPEKFPFKRPQGVRVGGFRQATLLRQGRRTRRPLATVKWRAGLERSAPASLKGAPASAPVGVGVGVPVPASLSVIAKRGTGH